MTRGAALVLGIIIVIGAAIWWFGGRAPVTPPDARIDFSEEGTLVINNAGLRPDTWYLVYEVPGAPGLQKALAFDNDSLCEGAPCDLSTLAAGARVHISGINTGEEVLVRTLENVSRADESRDIVLYFYDPSLDEDESGNVRCSREGLVAVERTIPRTNTPIQDAVRLLLRGELSEDERDRGIETEFPLDGFVLTGASLTNGVLTLRFDDPRGETVGGSCRVGILWYQIEATARQFDGVEEVRFEPEELFQP